MLPSKRQCAIRWISCQLKQILAACATVCKQHLIAASAGLVSEAERAAFFAETPRSAEIAALWALQTPRHPKGTSGARYSCRP